MKGRPSPRAYAIIKLSPCGVAPIVTAELRTAPRVIPMQGVQPLAKPMPSRKPPATPPPWGAVFITRYSVSRNGTRITPATWSAMTITSTPATTGRYARMGCTASVNT